MLNRQLATLESALRCFSRVDLACVATLAIDRLDALDPDPDGEDNGDDEPAGDEADSAWSEWNTRGRHKLMRGDAEMGETSSLASHEDAEDDDPAEQDDEPEDADSDRCATGDDHMIGGAVAQRDHWDRYERGRRPGDDTDAEGVERYSGAYRVDQSRGPLDQRGLWSVGYNPERAVA